MDYFCQNCEKLKDRLVELDCQLYLSRNELETHMKAWKANNAHYSLEVDGLKKHISTIVQIAEAALKNNDLYQHIASKKPL